MTSIEFVSLNKFTESAELQQEYGSYTKFLTAYTKSLSQTSLMSFAKNNKDALYSLPESIRESIWARSKQADQNKENAGIAYYTAVKAEDVADAAKAKAYGEFKSLELQYQKDDSNYSENKYDMAQNKYMTAMKTASGAEFSRKLLGEHMVSASKLAQSAFVNGVIADNMLNIKS